MVGQCHRGLHHVRSAAPTRRMRRIIWVDSMSAGFSPAIIIQQDAWLIASARAISRRFHAAHRQAACFGCSGTWSSALLATSAHPACHGSMCG